MGLDWASMRVIDSALTPFRQPVHEPSAQQMIMMLNCCPATVMLEKRGKPHVAVLIGTTLSAAGAIWLRARSAIKACKTSAIH